MVAQRAIASLAMIPIDAIDASPNVRSDVGDIDGLAATITEMGLLQPVRVRRAGPDRYHVVVGSRRVAAARAAGEAFVPAVLDVSDPDAARDALAQLVENLQRSDLPPMDLARSLRTILDADPSLTQKELARRLGFTGSWLTNILALLKAPPEVQLLAEQGRVTSEAVRRVTTLPPERQVELMSLYAGGRLTYPALERAVNASASDVRPSRPGPRRQRATRHRLLVEVGALLSGIVDDVRPLTDEEAEAFDRIRHSIDVIARRHDPPVRAVPVPAVISHRRVVDGGRTKRQQLREARSA